MDSSSLGLGEQITGFCREPDAEPIPGYRLIDMLGTGGFGEVWKCEAPGGLFKAIKFVFGNLNGVDGDSIRAEQELGALNRVKEIRHPFVLSMDRIEVVDGELVIVMELADKSLHDRYLECQAAGLIGIPRDDLLRYMRDAAEALDHMIEKHHLQHLDIKPRNLFLISDRVKVADFGLVKQIERQSGMMNGITPLYAAPETFSGQISEHSDQYSLAIVYYELLTGQRPFNGKTGRQLILQHTQEQPELRALPEAERPVVARALAKDPSQRFPNCMAFVRALYMARTPPQAGTAPATGEGRSRTMADTMEDIYLEQAESAQEPVPDSDEELGLDGNSRLGLTMSLPQTGALRPTLVIGLGSFGHRTLLELRGRLLDRFGSLDKVPLIRLMYVDPDLKSVRSATRGGEIACSDADVYHLPLQPVGNYRRRMLEQLSEWMPREKLYAMPRSLQTQGCRALGRLAFADNHLRFMARLRREIQGVVHPDAIYQAVTRTGLAIRSNKPRIYVIAAAGGGSSGILPDVGYGLRRLLGQLRYPNAEVIGLLFCGAPEDPATPRPELANVYATLTELNHFMDPGVRFTAQYGADGQRAIDQGPPFHQIYLLKLAHRSPESLRDAVAHLGSYLFHDVATPLGARLDHQRSSVCPPGLTPFRSFGTYDVWFPRGLLLRVAARQACVRLLGQWQEAGEPTAAAEVEAACARILADPELSFEAVCGRIQDGASSAFDSSLNVALTSFLSTLEEQAQQSIALDDPGSWAEQAIRRVQEWLGVAGRSITDSGWRRSRLSRALLASLQKLAEEWKTRLGQAAFQLMEHPGLRIAAAEAALERLLDFCQEIITAHEGHVQQQSTRTNQAWVHLERALEMCRSGSGGFSLFGGRSRRNLRVFMDHLAAFSRQRLLEEVFSAGVHFFATLRSLLQEQLRSLAICRQQLRHAQETLEEPPEDTPDSLSGHGHDQSVAQLPPSSTEAYWESIRDSKTTHPVLPDGATELLEAARRFVATVTPEQWHGLDQSLQDQVLAGQGGLHRACVGKGDLSRWFCHLLLSSAAAYLEQLLPVTDVADAEFSNATDAQGLNARLNTYLHRATPLVAASDQMNHKTFLLVPASDAGKRFGDEARQALPDVELVKVPGHADLMLCSEQGYLAAGDLQPVLGACRQAYETTVNTPLTSPHARFDILDWIPLDP